MSVQRLRSNKILGLAMTEQSILLAEIAVSGGKRELVKAAEFPYPAGTLPSDFTALGRPLSAFIKKQGFGSRQAVIGLPARWVMVKPAELPPADGPAAAKILALQAETAFTSELKDLVFDYSGQSDRSHPSTVLLMAVPKKRLGEIQEMATLARLTVRAILPSVAALGSAMAAQTGHERLVLHIGARAVELAAYHGTELERMRHVMTLSPTAVRTGQFPADLGPELRRSIASMPLNGTKPEDRRLLLWDELAHDASARQAFGDRLGVMVDAPALDALKVTAATDVADSARFAAAAALACVGLDTAAPAVNFADSRMIVADDTKPIRKYVWIGAVALLVLLGVGWLVVDTSRLESQAVALNKELAAKKKDVDLDSKKIQRVVFAKTWATHDTRFSGAQAAIVQAFPANYSIAFLKSYDLQMGLTSDKFAPKQVIKATLSGQAIDEVTANQISANLLSNPKLDRVTISNIQQIGGAAKGVTFNITFNYTAME